MGDTDEKKSKCGISNIIDGLTDYEPFCRRSHMRTRNNKDSLKPCTLDDEVSLNSEYIINCWNNRRTANPIPAGVRNKWVRSELVLRQIYGSRLCEVCSRWKIDDIVLSIGLQLTRWYWNINGAENTNNETTWWNERKGKNWDTANLNQIIFYKWSEAHDRQFWTDRLWILKKLESGKGHQDTSSSGAPRASIRGHAKISPQIAGILALASVRTTSCRLAMITKRNAVSPLLVGSAEPRGENSVCVSRV